MANSMDELLSANANDVMIIPGTTPTLSFNINSTLIKHTRAIRLDVVQEGVVILQSNNITILNNKAFHNFTQDETYMFSEGKIDIQIHGITEDNVAWKSKVITLNVGRSLTNTQINKSIGGL